MEQTAAICAVLIENRSDRPLMSTADEFTILEDLVGVLDPTEKSTELLSGSKYASFLHVSSAMAAVAQFP